MIKFLPVLSESLRGILQNLNKEYPGDNICKEILRIDRLMEFYLNNKTNVPEIVPIFEEELTKSLKNEVIMLSGRYGEEFEISFLPADREPQYTDDGKWARCNRKTGRPGKIFQKLISKEFKQYDWEQFVNRFKSTMCCSTNFELVSGEAITYWYNSQHYYRCDGTLGNSCMKYDECERYFEVYEDHAKMLITTKNGLLTGRAIVWELGNDVTIMDRVYTCYDYLENCFYEYAKEHKWWIRSNNHLLNNGDEQGWYSPDDDYTNINFKEFRINIGHRYDYFPYVDSFRYFDGEDTLSTHPVFSIELSNTDGSYDYDEASEWCCDRCGTTYYSYNSDDVPDELHYSDYSGEYYCDDCCWWCDYLQDYITNDDENVTVHTKDTEFDVPRSWAENRAYREINDEFYSEDDFTFHRNEITGDWELDK